MLNKLKRCSCILIYTVLVHNSNLYSTELSTSINSLSNWRKSNNFVSKNKCLFSNQYSYSHYNEPVKSRIFNYLFPMYTKQTEIPKIVIYYLQEQEKYYQNIDNLNTSFITNKNTNKKSINNKYNNKKNYSNKFDIKINDNRIENKSEYKSRQLYSNSNDMLCNILESQINNLQYTDIPNKKKKLNKNIIKITLPKEDVKNNNISNNNQVFNNNKIDIVENTISNNCEETNISNNEINICVNDIENINNNNKSINEANKNKIKLEDINDDNKDVKEEDDCNEEEVQDDGNSVIKPPKKNKRLKKLIAREIKAKQLANKRKRRNNKKIANQKENEVSQNENIEHNNNTKSIQEENNKNEIKIDIKNNEEQEDTKINENQLNNIKNDNLYSNKIINDSIQKNKILIDSINNIIITDETTEDDKIEDNDKENEEQQTNKKKKKKNKNRYKFIKEEKNTIDDKNKDEDKENKKIQKKQLKKEQKLKEQEEEKKRQQKIEFNNKKIQDIENNVAEFKFSINKILCKNSKMKGNKDINDLYRGITNHFDKILCTLMDYFDLYLSNKSFEEFTNEDKLIISLSHTISEIQVFNKNAYNDHINNRKLDMLLINIMMNTGIESCTNGNDLVKWIQKNTITKGMENINLKLYKKFIIYGIYNTLGNRTSLYQYKVYTKLYNYFKPIISYTNKHEIIFEHFKNQRNNDSNILNNNDREYLIKEYSKVLLPTFIDLFDNTISFYDSKVKSQYKKFLLNILIAIKSCITVDDVYVMIGNEITDFIIQYCDSKLLNIIKNMTVKEISSQKIDDFYKLIEKETNRKKIDLAIYDFAYKFQYNKTVTDK